jgi:2-polyprenyl-3-methyl-5-hydroxy-6-metoxy-1,4-benzoquinol methylase
VINQPDVYLRARDIADRLGAWALVDVGAESGMKLADISNGRNVIALDYGANLQRGIRRYPQFSWRQYDVEADDALPVEPAELKGTVVICADVIEHVEHPDRLLRALRAALSRGALAVLLSTPDHSPPRESLGVSALASIFGRLVPCYTVGCGRHAVSSRMLSESCANSSARADCQPFASGSAAGPYPVAAPPKRICVSILR